MIAGEQHCPCPGPCDRCGHVTYNTGDCDRCLNVKPARPLPVYAFARTKDAAGHVVWRRAA